MRLVQQRIADPSALTIVLAPSALTFSIGVVVALLLRSSEHGNHSDLVLSRRRRKRYRQAHQQFHCPRLPLKAVEMSNVAVARVGA